MADFVHDPRAALDRLLADKGIDYARLSQVIGRNPAYIQQYIKRGSPRRLPARPPVSSPMSNSPSTRIGTWWNAPRYRTPIRNATPNP